jgi:hypothetical protein
MNIWVLIFFIHVHLILTSLYKIPHIFFLHRIIIMIKFLFQ